MAALLGGVLVPVDRLHRALHPIAGRRRDRDALGLDTTISPLSTYWPLAYGRRRAPPRPRLLALAPTDDQRAPSSRPPRLGLLQAHRDECIVTLQLGRITPHRVGQVAVDSAAAIESRSPRRRSLVDTLPAAANTFSLARVPTGADDPMCCGESPMVCDASSATMTRRDTTFACYVVMAQ